MFWKKESVEKGTLRKRLQEDEEAEIGLTRARVWFVRVKKERENRKAQFMCVQKPTSSSQELERQLAALRTLSSFPFAPLTHKHTHLLSGYL